MSAAQQVALAPATPAANALDEFFVDPAEFRKKKDLSAETPPATANVTEPGTDLVDLFISPEQFRKERKPRVPSRRGGTAAAAR